MNVLELLNRQRGLLSVARSTIDALRAESQGLEGKIVTVDWDLVRLLVEKMLNSLDALATCEHLLVSEKKIPALHRQGAALHWQRLLFLRQHVLTLDESLARREGADRIKRFLEHDHLIDHIAEEVKRLDTELAPLRATESRQVA